MTNLQVAKICFFAFFRLISPFRVHGLVMKQTKLPPDLQAAWEKIEQYAKDYGLDFFPISFEMLDYSTLYEVAAMGGFPIRYPHWRFGMEYDRLAKGYDYGLSVIYEMVINTDPSYAYLLEGNEMVTQKMVMAHVTGHVDFFKHNMWFSHTNRKMLDEMGNHATRIQRLINKHGYDKIEEFIDICLSLENLIDYHAPYIKRPESQTPQPIVGENESPSVEGLKVDRDYMRRYINPPEFLEQQRQKQVVEQNKARNFPENPQKDILLFLLDYAPLERWQRTILEIIRDEAYYFAPQGMTKVINEGWACLTKGSLLYTQQGLLPIDEVVKQRLAVQVSDGEETRQIYDWAKFSQRDTMWLRTRRGLELEGSTNHRVMLADGQWKRLDELQIGDEVKISGGQNVWAQEYVTLAAWQPKQRLTLNDVADMAQVNLSTVIRYRQGRRGPNSETLAPLVAMYEADLATLGQIQPCRRQAILFPLQIDEDVAAFLGYLVGDGHISTVKRVIGLTTGDEAQADRFINLVEILFGLTAMKRWDEGRWRVNFSSQEVSDWLQHLGMKTGPSARFKEVPQVILRSPKTVVAAFLRAYYDCDGYAGKQGVILSTSSESLAQTIPLLLLNFGILFRKRQQQDGCWHVQVMGQSAQQFWQEIGFGLERKQDALRQYITEHSWFKTETWTDEIIALEPRQAEVYDMSVETTHRYAAQGFINHNSYWHSRIMTEKAMEDSEIISFADHHAGVVATSAGQLNPYKMGLELLRDIEDRWNKGKFGKEYDECDDLREKRMWDKQLGLGRQKIFEVRKLYNDVTFIDEFLTPEFVIEQNMFSFRYNANNNLYEIVSREFKAVKEKLLFQLTNFGQPFIYVENGNYKNRGELYLRHRHEGVDLKLNYAYDTLQNLYRIWTRPVHLETAVNGQGQIVTYDGTQFTEKKM